MKPLKVLLAGVLWLCPGTALFAQAKKACDLIPKADVEAALGAPLFIVPGTKDSLENCGYTNKDPFENAPPRTLSFTVQLLRESKPDSEAVSNATRRFKDRFRSEPQKVSDIGDAALFMGNESAGQLDVFSGGTVTLSLQGTMSLDKLKAFALKVLGGSGKTGYVYDAPFHAPNALTEAPVVGGGSFSRAVYLTQSQFLKQLKEVALTVVSDPALAQHVSASDIRNYVTKGLSGYGIAVNPNAAVALVATVDELKTTLRKTVIYTRSSTTEDFHLHNVYVSLDFFVRAAAVRNGKFHLLAAVPARAWAEDQYVEDSELRKYIIGDETKSDIKSVVASLINDSLQEIASNTTVDPAPFYAGTLAAKDQAMADAEFVRIMNSGQAAEKRVIDGIDSLPQLDLENYQTDDPDAGCPSDRSWSNFWNADFARNGWARTSGQPGLALKHFFYCSHQGVLRFGVGYFRIFDDVSLRESNLVFELNGRIFRKPATLFSSHRMITALPDTLDGVLQGFIPRSVSEFSTNLVLGNSKPPTLAATPLRLAAEPAPPPAPPTPGPAGAAAIPDAWERQWDAPLYPVSAYTSELSRKAALILQGTVARVTVDTKGFPQWLRIYFKEAADAAVIVCSPSPDIFARFGEDYKGLIGRTLEVAGSIDGLCTPHGGIRVVESKQFRVRRTVPGIP